MSWKFSLYNNWYDDLCEYYNVDAETALQLGTRSKGRKPSLPGSKTCKSVSNMTFEDIWDQGPRDKLEEIFQFQRDLGAWSSFRQCVRHKDFADLHLSLVRPFIEEGTHLCEYGSGAAPFSKTLLNNMVHGMPSIKISLSDIEGCEHLCFAEWRLKKQVEKNNLDVELEIRPVIPDTLPKYSSNLDIVIIFEVLEHVYSPMDTVKNLYDQMNVGAVFIENFIKHEHEHDKDGSDLESAAEQRGLYYEFLSEKFILIGGPEEKAQPNATRIWRKNETI
tara:strand:- start:2484 stop:3314 length:831 start_codon:yes stop_codon:yes gene_type:complete